MSTRATPETTSADPAPWVRASLGLVVVCVLTYALTRLSLDHPPGVTRRPNGGCCDTEFVNNDWWTSLAVLAVPIWWVARCLPWAAIPAFVVPTYASFHIASTVVHRYQVSGWGDGLEVFAYVGGIAHGIVFACAAAIGIFSWRRRRRRRPRDASAPDGMLPE